MDYKKYQFSWIQVAGVLLQAVLFTGIIAYLFYSSLCGMVFGPVLFVILMRRKKANCIAQRKRMLHGEFLDALKIVSTSLMSGMSMENAWREASKEMQVMHSKKSVIYRELEEMNHLVETNIPMEKVLIQFAYRSGVEDIISFAEVFEYGKRSGANWRKLIHDTTLRMEEKYETEKQIQIMLTEKKMEQKIMSVIPLGMILFLRVTSKDYMDVLYGNPFGIICMTICLMGYGVALYMAERIMKVQV